MNKVLIYILLTGTLYFGCTKENVFNPGNVVTSELEKGWLVPLDQLVLSELPADRIESIDSPYFEEIDNTIIGTNEIMYAYRFGDTVKLYPESIIGGHEIVNDKIGNHYFAITYCPLTGSALAWDREIAGNITEFGVSGHLYNENLIPYDRSGISYWSQMKLQSIKGNSAGDELNSYLLLKLTGDVATRSFSNALVLVDTSGHSCNDSICGGLKGQLDFGNPSDNDDFVLPSRGDYFGIVNVGIVNGGVGALLFNYDNFIDSISMHHTNFHNSEVIILGSNSLQFIVAFTNNTKYPSSDFNVVQNSLPVVLSDKAGNKYDITGKVVSGPSIGNRLPSPISYTAHSFAWELLFGNQIEIFE